jgi:aldose 1-epimerase
MFNSDKYYLGEFEVITVGRQDGPGIELIPAKGAVVHQLYLGNEAIPILYGFDSAEDLATNDKFKQAMLFPFPNRLKDGKYSFADTAYSFEVNETDRRNALHGMVYDESFVVTELELTNDYGRIELTYLYHGQNESYPFPFTLRTTYEISDDYFRLGIQVENTGFDTIPYGLGWHPYFKTDSLAKIGAKAALLQKVNERMLPTGEQMTFEFGHEPEGLKDKLDNAFRINNNESLAIDFGLFGGKMARMTADNSFRFFQVYNPAGDIVAVEPVTCNINALNTGDGLIHLQKGDVGEHQVELVLL